MTTATATDPPEHATSQSIPPRGRNAALRAALIAETRIAEALAQRSRGLVALVERLNQRVLAEADDIGAARLRLNALWGALREGLAAGETAEEGCLRVMAATTLAAFDFGEGPRIAIDGPPARLAPEARRLVSLLLFDLASRSERFGALGARDGRVALDWTAQAGGIRLTWREFGARPGSEGLHRGAGGALTDLLADRFGAPLRQRSAPFGLIAELWIPAEAICAPPAPLPQRVLIAIDDAALAVTLGALLLVCGVPEVGSARSIDEAAAAIAEGDVDLVFVDDARAGAMPQSCRPALLAVAPATAEAGGGGALLRLPVSAARLAEVMAEAIRARGIRPAG